MGLHARKQRKSASTDAILKVAAEEFAAKGYAGARIDEIALRAGINKAMLYYHIGDKQELHSAVVLSIMRPALAMLQELVSQPLPPEQKLRTLVDALARYAAEHAVMPRIMLHEIAAGGAHLSEEVIACIAGIFGTVRQVLDEGERSGVFRATDPLATHFSIIAATMLYVAAEPIRVRVGQALGFPAMAERPAPATAEHLVTMILHGLVAAENER